MYLNIKGIYISYTSYIAKKGKISNGNFGEVVSGWVVLVYQNLPTVGLTYSYYIIQRETSWI